MFKLKNSRKCCIKTIKNILSNNMIFLYINKTKMKEQFYIIVIVICNPHFFKVQYENSVIYLF